MIGLLQPCWGDLWYVYLSLGKNLRQWLYSLVHQGGVIGWNQENKPSCHHGPLIDMLQRYSHKSHRSFTPLLCAHAHVYTHICTVEMTNAWIYTEQRNRSERVRETEYYDRVKFNLKVPLTKVPWCHSWASRCSISFCTSMKYSLGVFKQSVTTGYPYNTCRMKSNDKCSSSAILMSYTSFVFHLVLWAFPSASAILCM